MLLTFLHKPLLIFEYSRNIFFIYGIFQNNINVSYVPLVVLFSYTLSSYVNI